MKQIKSLCLSYIEPILLIAVLVIFMIAQSQLNMFILWLAFSMLLGLALWRLRKPALYYSLIKDKAFLAFCLLIIWGIVSCIFWTQAGINSIVFLLIFSTGIFAYFIGYTDKPLTSQHTQNLLLILGLALVVLTYYQFFALGMKRPIGLFLNWNTHAAFLAMILLTLILPYAFKPRVNTLQLLLPCIISMLFSFALGLTQSRGAIMLLAVAVFCVALFAWRQRLHPSYRQCLFLLVAIFLGYLYSGLFVNEPVFQRLGNVSEMQNFSNASSGRHLLWAPAWQMFLDNPYTGWGLDAYDSLFAQYKAPLTNEAGNFAHNDFLQILLELGPVGLFFILAYVFFILQRYYYLLENKTGIKHSSTVAILLAIAIGMLAHTFFTFHLYQSAMVTLLNYYLGRAAKITHTEQGFWAENTTLPISKSFIWIYRIVCSLIILCIAVYAYATYHIAAAEKVTSLTDKVYNYQIATRFIPALDKEEAVSSHYFTLLLKTEKNPEERKKIATHTLKVVDIAIEKMPLFKYNYITRADALIAMQSDYSKIIEQYVMLLKLDPYYLDYRYEYAKLLNENGQHKQALQILWGGWGLLYSNLPYQKGITYLYYQLQMLYMYGNTEYIGVIEQQIEKLKQKKRYRTNGQYVFEKPF